MSRISLNDLSTFRSNFKLKDVADTASLKDKIIPTTRTGDFKPAAYAADEQYVQIFKLGPIIADLIDSVKALETQSVHLRDFVSGQLGDTADDAQLPPDIYTVKRDGQVIKLLSDGIWVGPSSGLQGAQGA